MKNEYTRNPSSIDKGEEYKFSTNLHLGQKVWFIYNNQMFSGICQPLIRIEFIKYGFGFDNELLIPVEIISDVGTPRIPACELWTDKEAFIKHFRNQLDKL